MPFTPNEALLGVDYDLYMAILDSETLGAVLT